MNKRFISLFFSILTACVTGVAVAFFGIGVWASIDKKAPKEEIDTGTLEEADQDPSFVTRFSRTFIYSADDGAEIIESAKNSLPQTANTKVTASSYVVMDIDRKIAVLEKDADRLLPIASITKLITAVVSLKLMDKNDSVVVTRQALGTYGNEARLREGEKFKVDELIYPLLMVSSNDAAEILAQAYGRKNFIKEMNSWVNEIGAYRTYFIDPSGLSAQNISTARDISIIAQWIWENEPELFDITLQKAKTIRTHTWINPTHFLNLTSYIGGKNGYTPEANRTSVSLFKLGRYKKIYAVILLASEARDSDILDLLEEAVR